MLKLADGKVGERDVCPEPTRVVHLIVYILRGEKNFYPNFTSFRVSDNHQYHLTRDDRLNKLYINNSFIDS